LLVHTFVALLDDLVWIVDETAAYAWQPGSEAAAALTPADHALAVKGDLLGRIVHLWQVDVLRFAVQSLALLYHFNFLSSCFIFWN